MVIYLFSHQVICMGNTLMPKKIMKEAEKVRTTYFAYNAMSKCQNIYHTFPQGFYTKIEYCQIRCNAIMVRLILFGSWMEAEVCNKCNIESNMKESGWELGKGLGTIRGSASSLNTSCIIIISKFCKNLGLWKGQLENLRGHLYTTLWWRQDATNWFSIAQLLNKGELRICVVSIVSNSFPQVIKPKWTHEKYKVSI